MDKRRSHRTKHRLTCQLQVGRQLFPAVVRDLVNRLPDELREVVELRIDGGVSFKDIASILDIPQGTALWRMHRAVEILRMQWRTYEPHKV